MEGAPADLPFADRLSAVRSLWPCRLGLLAMAVWCTTLITLALFSANPVTLSEPQIQQAQLIVTGIPEAGSGLLVVERIWWGELADEKVLVTNLEEVPNLQPGLPYIVPLTPIGENYRITTLLEQTHPPRITPASPEAIAQLKLLLRNRKSAGN
jgi:hypothetical protein